MTYLIVFCTVSSRGEARKISDALLKARLAACVNILPSIESRYLWKKKREKAREFLLLIKTRSSLFPKLSKEIRRHHSYSVPEIIGLPILKGNSDYLRWLAEQTR